MVLSFSPSYPNQPLSGGFSDYLYICCKSPKFYGLKIEVNGSERKRHEYRFMQPFKTRQMWLALVQSRACTTGPICHPESWPW